MQLVKLPGVSQYNFLLDTYDLVKASKSLSLKTTSPKQEIFYVRDLPKAKDLILPK